MTTLSGERRAVRGLPAAAPVAGELNRGAGPSPCLQTAFAAIAAACSPRPLTARAQSAGPTIADDTLANGLELVVIPDHRAPVVTHMIWYKVGAADETPGKSGLAHFLEHLMFKGTAKHPIGTFSQVVARNGGQENAFTSSDYTGYYQRVPSEQLKTVMEFEADRMTGLQLTDQVVLPEREVILEEQNQRIGNNPRARLASRSTPRCTSTTRTAGR